MLQKTVILAVTKKIIVKKMTGRHREKIFQKTVFLAAEISTGLHFLKEDYKHLTGLISRFSYPLLSFN